MLNAGSSTIKYRLDGGDRVLVFSGLVERTGRTAPGWSTAPPTAMSGSSSAPSPITPTVSGCCSSSWGTRPTRRLAVGHRIVNGGDRFTSPALADDAALAELEALTPARALAQPGRGGGHRGCL